MPDSGRRLWPAAASSALITGLLAFVIAAGVVTASELALFGGSVSGDRRTSLFGGQKSPSTSSDDAKDEATPTATPDQEATPSPEATETPAPTATATPTPSATASPAPTESVTPAPTP